MMISADLGHQLEAFVAKLVESGRFKSSSEVLREGVRLIRDREGRLAEVQEAITRGLADVDSGRTKPAEEVFDRLERKYQAVPEGGS